MLTFSAGRSPRLLMPGTPDSSWSEARNVAACSIGLITLGVTAVAASSLLLAQDTPGPSGPDRESVTLILVGTLLTLLSQLIGAVLPNV